MFGYCGTQESDVSELFSGLRRACADDPALQAVSPGCSRHGHGWGYVIHAENGLFHYRTSNPIYDDDVILPKLKGRIRAIFHGRHASNEELIGHIFTHPFVASDDAKTTFFAHNGGIKVGDLPERKVDSEWALDQIVAMGGVAQALPKLKEHTTSALNLLILEIDRSKSASAKLQYFQYFKPKEPGKVKYYTMFEGAMPGGRALVSSTMTFPEAGLQNLTNLRPAIFDSLKSLELP